MRKENPACTWKEVYVVLRTQHPTYFGFGDNRTVERWAFTKDLSQKNRGTPVKDPKVKEAIMDRHSDPTISDENKTSRKMAAHFTANGMPVSDRYVRQIYFENDLYPAREHEELDLHQHHHRRMREHFAQEHLEMTEKEWEAWIWSDECIIRMKKVSNPKNFVKWVKRGTKRPNPKPTAKHVPSLKAWGAIGGYGKKSELFIFRQILTGALYNEILEEYALPFYKEILKDYPKAKLMEDGDPKHNYKPNLKFREDNFKSFTKKPPVPCRCNIQYTGKRDRPKSDPCEVCVCPLLEEEIWPANSADLSPKENNWALLKSKIWEGNPTITTLDQLEEAAHVAWEKITQAEILAMQNSMPGRMEALDESEGWPIDY